MMVTVQSGPVTGRGVVTWVGPVGGNLNWALGANWFFPPEPAAPDFLPTLDNNGVSAAAGVADNEVNASATIAGL